MLSPAVITKNFIDPVFSPSCYKRPAMLSGITDFSPTTECDRIDWCNNHC